MWTSGVEGLLCVVGDDDLFYLELLLVLFPRSWSTIPLTYERSSRHSCLRWFFLFCFFHHLAPPLLSSHPFCCIS